MLIKGHFEKAKSVLLIGITEQAQPIQYLRSVFTVFCKEKRIDYACKENPVADEFPVVETSQGSPPQLSHINSLNLSEESLIKPFIHVSAANDSLKSLKNPIDLPSTALRIQRVDLKPSLSSLKQKPKQRFKLSRLNVAKLGKITLFTTHL